MPTYTAIDLAVLRAGSEMDAARELIALPCADLMLIVQFLHIKIRRGGCLGPHHTRGRYPH